MREINFRAWDGEAMHYDVTPWRWDFVISLGTHKCVESTGDGPLGSGGKTARFEVPGISFKEIMQFTGILDKNGKGIYEGDVLAERGNLNRVGLVRYEPNIASFMVLVEGGYCHLNEGDWGNGPQLKYTEVVGNIYEHRFLLDSR